MLRKFDKCIKIIYNGDVQSKLNIIKIMYNVLDNIAHIKV
jgi:hypothetical protein